MSKELLKRVRDTLHGLEETHYDLYWDIQAELDKPEQEPVAWRKWDGYGFLLREYDNGGEPLFTSPQSVKLRNNWRNKMKNENLVDTSAYKLDFPEPSKWKCYMFGNSERGSGMVYHPSEGDVPNVFVRWMMKVCFACTWVKVNGIGEGND